MRRSQRLTRTVFATITVFSFFAGGFLSADSLENIAKKISSSAKGLVNKKVAVLPFPYHDGRESKGSTIVSERLITKLVEQKKLEVIERSLLEKVFKELKLQSSGAIDEKSAKEIGKVLGVEAIVSGTLIDLGEEEVEVNARLIKTETGQIVVASSGKVDRFWKEEAKEPKAPAKAEAPQPQSQEKPAALQSRAVPTQPAGPSMVLSNRDVPHSVPPPYRGEGMEGEMGEDMGGEMEPPRQWPPPHPPAEPFDFQEEGRGIWFGPEDSLLIESNFPPELVESPIGQKIVQGTRLLKRGESEAAEKHFQEIQDNFSGDPRLAAVIQLGRGISLFQLDQKEKAFHLVESVARQERWPRVSAVAHFILGRFNENSNKSAAAKEHYLEVVRSIPFQTLLVRQAGRRLRHLSGDNFDRAERMEPSPEDRRPDERMERPRPRPEFRRRKAFRY
ncbi:MAG: hypothetical protein HY610_02375 [Elusimicrobia bacterium]|nr:hypothetical protein [Elusimicrobiota bacterium]